MRKKITQKMTALAAYIRLREKKENKENIFLEPIARAGTSDDQIKFNLITALIDNGFTPKKDVQEWYAQQQSIRKKRGGING